MLVSRGVVPQHSSTVGDGSEQVKSFSSDQETRVSFIVQQGSSRYYDTMSPVLKYMHTSSAILVRAYSKYATVKRGSVSREMEASRISVKFLTRE